MKVGDVVLYVAGGGKGPGATRYWAEAKVVRILQFDSGPRVMLKLEDGTKFEREASELAVREVEK